MESHPIRPRPAARRAAGNQRRRPLRDERGATGLVEMLVATALSLILLAMIAKIGDLTERSITADRTLYGAQDGALAALSSAVSHLSSAAPLGVCQSAPPSASPYSVALSGCQTVSQSGPVIAAAVSAGSAPSGPNGFCYYDYAGLSPGLDPPTLECAVDYPAQGQVYVVTYQPSSGATYTSCDPSTCFGTQAPPPGELPSLPSPSSCSARPASQGGGCSAKLVGTVEGNQAGFNFTAAGVPVDLGPSSPATTLAGVSSVQVRLVVASGSFGQASSYTYHYSAAVPAVAYAEARSWAASQGAS